LLEIPRFPDDAVVLVVTNPPFLPTVGAIRRLVFRKPFVLLIHDVYPEIAVRLGVVRKGGIAHALLKALDRFVLSQADAVVVLGRDMRQRIVAKSPAWRHNRITVISNWADPDQISPMPKSDSPNARKDGLLETFVVQYSGNLGLSQPFDTILGAARELKGRDINFTFVGDGVLAEEVKARAVALGLDNVRFFPRVHGDDLGSSLAASDVAIVPLLPGVEGLSVPSKYYGILASGRPVIALMNPDAEVAQSVIENRCGVVVPPRDIQRLASAVLELQGDKDRLAQLGRNARAAFDRLHTRMRAVDAYEEILMQVGRQGHRTSPDHPGRRTI
jgi:glycosyltransferase involved in cell wall biosynthesis